MHRTPAAAVTAVLLLGAGCAAAPSTESDDCTSHYDPVASAGTWPSLKKAMLHDSRWGPGDRWGPVTSIRTQARGDEAGVGAGREDVVRVVDLLNHKGERVVQVDVWRTDDGAMQAGAWSQCID